MTPSGIRDYLSIKQRTSNSDLGSQMFGHGLTGIEECPVSPSHRDCLHAAAFLDILFIVRSESKVLHESLSILDI